MHELSIVHDLLDIAVSEAEKRGYHHVSRLTCRIGWLRQADPLLLREAFSVACEGTIAANAELEVITRGMYLECHTCGQRGEVIGWQFRCPICYSDDVELQGGDELELTAIDCEVDDGD